MRLSSSLLLAALLSGCVASGSMPGGGSRSTNVDSLRAENATLRDQNRALRDSLRVYDDVDTGRYYRELRALRDQMTRMSYELDALRDGGQTVAVLQADVLFEPASATVSADGADALVSVAAQIRQAYPDRRIRVEGHSDDTPLGGSLKERYPSNWELSTARASAVVRTLIDLSGLDTGQFVAVGYSATDPVASNETASGRRRNRRVRIAVLPTPREFQRPFETSW